MKVEMRLKQVLGEYGLLHHGVVRDMAKATGYHRHSITKVLQNTISHPSLEMLGAISDYLIENNVPPDILPGALFGVRPQILWDAVAKLGRVTIFVGEYQQANGRWIAAADAQVENLLVEYLSKGHVATPQVSTEYIPLHYVEDSKKNKQLFDADVHQAGKIFESMQTLVQRRSTILIGSQRTNYLLEYVMADLIGCAPFQPNNAPPPVYLKHRSKDHVVPSCFGGKRKPPGSKGATPPGVYYRGKSGWVACPWEDKKKNAGVVVVIRDPGTEGTELALFGFTGRGTQVIGRALLKEDFWQPMVAVERRGREIAMFVCEFTFQDEDDSTMTLETSSFSLTPLDREVLDKHLR